MAFWRTRLSIFILLELSYLTTVLAQTCSSTSPCAQGCCSKYGSCGFGPAFCGEGNCTSTCNAVAQCGQYAPTGSENCPLNVCCSQFGFCGTTSDFCGTGCQSGCSVPTKPSCSSSGGSSSKRTIGYYESWSYTRSCNNWDPAMIEPAKWTHLNYAFALIDPNTFKISQMNTFDTELYPRFTGLKEQNSALQVFISVGGWSAGGQIFSNMTASAANRAAFITSAISFMQTYSFDGIDIDWEYPVATERGGSAADFQNYVTFLKELRAACGTTFGVTATLPSSYWYMQNFDIVNMEPYLDWFNIMTYDIHGTWDGNNPYTKAVVQAHTNLTEIDQALDLLWRNNIDSSKVVLGLAFYGRSFTLKDPSCSAPGCPFASGGTQGQCTQTSGILSDSEIQGIIAQYDIIPTLDSDAAVKYMTWDNNQWVSYDDAQTFAMKVEYANSLCLGGTMVWALDLDNTVNTTSIDNLNSMNFVSFNPVIKTATVASNAATLGIFWTPCLPPGSQACPPGYDPIVWGHGKIFDADLGHLTGEGCHGGGNGFNRVLCAPSNVRASGCQWGPGRNGKSCNSKCPSGWLTLTKNSHIAGQKSGCKTGTYAPLCCQSVSARTNGWCYAKTRDHVLSGSLAARDNTLGITLSNFQSTNDQKKVKRNVKLKQWTGTKALSKRAGSYDTWGCGGSLYLPLNAIPVDVPARLLNTYIGDGQYSVNLSPTATASATKKSRKTITVPKRVDVTIYSTGTRWCDGSKYPQACHHYSSVAQYSTYQKPTCAPDGDENPRRPLVDFYDSTDEITQHNSIWSKEWITKTYINPNGKRAPPRCQRDEWPPALFQQGRPDGYIRLLPGSQNGGIPNTKLGGWKGFCKYPPDQQVKVEGGPIVIVGDIVYETIITSSITTINVMDYSFFNMVAPQSDPWLLTTNPCYPSTLTKDPGFALLTWDLYYGGVPSRLPYSIPPTAKYTAGKTPPTKRDLFLENYPRFVRHSSSGSIFVDEGNSTRKATDEEMLEHFDLLKCQSDDCAQELEQYAQMVKEIKHAARVPLSVTADESTTTNNDLLEVPTMAAAVQGGHSDVISSFIPSVTSGVEIASSASSASSSSQVTAFLRDEEFVSARSLPT